MSEEVELLMEELKEGMDKAIKHLQDELVKIRTGKASPAMLGGLRVEYYGSPTPLSQVANVGTADAKTPVGGTVVDTGKLLEVGLAAGFKCGITDIAKIVFVADFSVVDGAAPALANATAMIDTGSPAILSL